MKKRLVVLTLAFLILVPGRIQSTTWSYSDAAGFRSLAEREHFMALLGKHFGGKVFSVVYAWETGSPYYFDKQGRKCWFK